MRPFEGLAILPVIPEAKPIDTVFDSTMHFLGACLVMVGAQTVYVLFGFGAGLIAVGAMALLVPSITDVVVLVLLVSLPSEIFVVTRSWKDIAWRGVVVVCVGLAAGVVLGAHVLVASEPTFVLTLLAGFLVLAGATFLVVPDRARVRWPAWTGLPVGTVSGVLAGLFGTGGPPLILYYQLAAVEKARFRGNLMAIFLVTAAVRLATYSVVGVITMPRLLSALALLPAALTGAWIGNRIHVEISEPRFRKLVSVALCLIGLVLLIR